MSALRKKPVKDWADVAAEKIGPCRNCAHWKRVDVFNYDLHTTMKTDLGRCAAVELGDPVFAIGIENSSISTIDLRRIKDRLAVAADAHAYPGATLLTREEFGCVLFKAKV